MALAMAPRRGGQRVGISRRMKPRAAAVGRYCCVRYEPSTMFAPLGSGTRYCADAGPPRPRWSSRGTGALSSRRTALTAPVSPASGSTDQWFAQLAAELRQQAGREHARHGTPAPTVARDDVQHAGGGGRGFVSKLAGRLRNSFAASTGVLRGHTGGSRTRLGFGTSGAMSLWAAVLTSGIAGRRDILASANPASVWCVVLIRPFRHGLSIHC